MMERPTLTRSATAALLASFLLGLSCAQKSDDAAKSGDAESQETQEPGTGRPAARSWQAPAGFEEMTIPSDNPMSPEKVALGEQLFFDDRLSGDGVRTCGSCHLCENGLTDGLATAVGAFNKKLPRSSPTLWNIGYHANFYWDGRSPSLEAQALAAWKGANMGANPDSIATALGAIAGYRDQFTKVFGTAPTADAITKALAAYERTILCGNTAFDRWQQGDETALTQRGKEGWEIFRGKAACGTCHAGILFTDLEYHNVGIGMDKEPPDIGRGKITQEEKHQGAFKTPTLRDVTRSAPYFHDGSVATLEEAVKTMAQGGKANPHRDPLLKPVELTGDEIGAVLEFLAALNCPCDVTAPPLP